MQKFTRFDIQLSSASVEDVKEWKGVGKKPLAKLTGKISEADIVNANGFIIPLQDWKDMLEANKERIQKGQCYCTIGHDERPIEDQDVRMGIIIMIITDMWIEGKDVFMTANVCNNSAGEDLMGFVGAGGYIQASTRLGIVPRKDENTGADSLVGAESVIFGVDLVLDPAIESTWVEFKSASKTKKVESKVELSFVDKAKQEREALETMISYNKQKIQEEQELNNFYKGKIK